jgi:GTPase
MATLLCKARRSALLHAHVRPPILIPPLVPPALATLPPPCAPRAAAPCRPYSKRALRRAEAQWDADEAAEEAAAGERSAAPVSPVEGADLRIAVLHAYPKGHGGGRGGSGAYRPPSFDASSASAHSDGGREVDVVEDDEAAGGGGGGGDAARRRDRHLLKLREAVALAEAAGFTVVADDLAPVGAVSASTFLGRGKVDEVRHLMCAAAAGAVFVNAALSPVQQRNLAAALGLAPHCVLDRVAVILQIFGRRARTREAQLQVRLAQLRHARSRLVAGGGAPVPPPPSTTTPDGDADGGAASAAGSSSGRHRLSQQRGGIGVMGGAGETKLELDRRSLDDEIRRVTRGLDDVVRTRALHRAARARAGLPTVSLIGYTNVGKSALAGALTGLGAGGKFRVKDALFATLDSTSRGINLPLPGGGDAASGAGAGGSTTTSGSSSGRALLVDTVGFVSDLPHALVASFRATLEEVTDADVLLHVRDGSHPEAASHALDVAAVLAQLGLDYAHLVSSGRLIEVWNKADAVPPLPSPPPPPSTVSPPDGGSSSRDTGDGLLSRAQAAEQAALLAAMRAANAVLRLPPGSGDDGGTRHRRRRAWDESASDDGGATETWEPPKLPQQQPLRGTASLESSDGDSDGDGGGGGGSFRGPPAAATGSRSTAADSPTAAGAGPGHVARVGPSVIAVSARTGVGLDVLTATLGARLAPLLRAAAAARHAP